MSLNDFVQVVVSPIGARGPQGPEGPPGQSGEGIGTVTGSTGTIGVFTGGTDISGSIPANVLIRADQTAIFSGSVNVGGKGYILPSYPDFMIASEAAGTSQSGSYIRLANNIGTGIEEHAGSIRLVPGKHASFTGDDDRGGVRFSDGSGSSAIFDAAGRLRMSGSINAQQAITSSFSGSGGHAMSISHSSLAGTIATHTNQPLRFSTNKTARWEIDATTSAMIPFSASYNLGSTAFPLGSVLTNRVILGTLPFADALQSSQSFASNGRTWFVGESATADGGGSQIFFNQTPGTLTSPTAIVSASRLGRIGATGHDGSNWELAARAMMRFSALENWTPSAKGTSIEFFVTPQGTTDVALPLQIRSTGIIVDGTITASAFSGTANHALTATSASWAPSTEGAPASWGSITGKPDGIVSSSGQVGLVASASHAATASYALNASGTDWTSLSGKPTGLVSSSGQVAYGAIAGVPTGLVSSSAQITSVSTASYAISASWAPGGGSVTWNDVSGKPVGIVSSSTQLPTSSFASSVMWTGINNRPVGLVSASAQVTKTWDDITSKPTGIVSNSAQIPLVASASLAATASYFSGSIEFPNGLTVTGSVTATSGFIGSASYASQALTASYALNGGGGASTWGDITGKPVGIVSSSTQLPTSSFASSVMWTGVNNKPTGLVSASAQVTKTWDDITSKPVGIVSSSTQLGVIPTASLALTASYFSGSVEFANGLIVTGSITATGGFIGSASYATSASWAPGGGSVTWNDVSGKPTGIVSSSTQLPTSSFASAVMWTGVNNKPTGLVSASGQVAYAGLSGVPSGLVSASAQVDKAWNDITSKPAGIVSSSTQVPLVTSASYLVNNRGTIAFTVASSGSIISTGYKGTVQVPSDCYIVSASTFTNQSGSVAIDIRRATSVATWNPAQNAGASLTGSASPLSQSNHIYSQNTTLTGWTRTLTTGDMLSVYVNAVSGSATLSNVVVSLAIVRN